MKKASRNRRIVNRRQSQRLMRQCAVYLRNYFFVQLKDCWLLLVYVDEIEHYRTGHSFGVVDRHVRRGKGRSEETESARAREFRDTRGCVVWPGGSLPFRQRNCAGRPEPARDARGLRANYWPTRRERRQPLSARLRRSS